MPMRLVGLRCATRCVIAYCGICAPFDVRVSCGAFSSRVGAPVGVSVRYSMCQRASWRVGALFYVSARQLTCRRVVQESLQSENVPDAAMETPDEPWPDEDALADAETLNKVARRRKVPCGMSEYQAAWIIDSGQWVLGATRRPSNAAKHTADRCLNLWCVLY